MKRIYILFFTLILNCFSYGQEFSFQMFFEDAIGNKDTLIFGYDINGTDTIDTPFGETNIISLPLDTGLDVRITNEFYNRCFLSIPGTFHTKNQIIQKNCNSGFSIINVDILTNNWPVTASWDSALFNDTCRIGSFLTSIAPGGWWDTGSPSNLDRIVLIGISQKTFNSNYNSSSSYNLSCDGYSYINSNNDTIPTFWQLFGDSTILIYSINEIKMSGYLDVFPNPTSGIINIESFDVIKIEVFDVTGKLIKSNVNKNSIDISNQPNGIYFVKCKENKKEVIYRKIVKTS